MLKEDLIRLFKDLCNHPINNEPRGAIGKGHRQVSVETQFNRDVWEVYSSIGKVRIRKDDTKYYIEIFGYSVNHVEYSISKQQYNELKDIYFGEFKPNNKYLKTLNSILPSFQ